mmetsp:Transcript_6829/g.16706  ORF Transcript_6829/g.16706 Transcript_6829/m.16706 type:complete len:318 (-) Transcript_6829:26-979(-)
MKMEISLVCLPIFLPACLLAGSESSEGHGGELVELSVNVAGLERRPLVLSDEIHQVIHDFVGGLWPAQRQGPLAHLTEPLLVLEPPQDGGGDLVGLVAVVPDLVVNHPGDVASLLARDEIVEHDGEPARQRLGDGSRTGLGDDAVRGRHPLVHVRHEPEDLHVRLPLPPLEPVHEVLVPAADDHDLAPSHLRKALVEGSAGFFDGAHAVAAADDQHGVQVSLEAQALPQSRLAQGVELGEGRPDGQAVHHELRLREAPPFPKLLGFHRRHEALVHALVEPRRVARRVVCHHRRERNLLRLVLLLPDILESRKCRHLE